MIVVSNSSPLIALSIVSLDLLYALYGNIYIPGAVFHEVVTRGAGRPGAAAAANSPWIVQQSPANRQTVTQLLSAGLDQGESEAIVLASELSGGLLILDESQVTIDFELLTFFPEPLAHHINWLGSAGIAIGKPGFDRLTNVDLVH